MKKNLFILLLVSIFIFIFFFSPYNESNKNNQTETNKYKKAEKFSYVYEKNFLNNEDFLLLKKELEKLDTALDKSVEKLPNVYRYNLVVESPIIKNLIKKYEKKIKKLVSNNKIYLANNFPIEYRKYVRGSYMLKHRDQLIYKIPQYECVFTITNSTDSNTVIGDKKISSEPNSIIILKAQGVEHEVTKVNNGERKFLKFIFTETDNFITNK